MYCKDCLKATCVLCVTTEHKKHDFTDIQEIIENRKQRIIIDLAEFENVIVPKCRNLTADVSFAELDKVFTDIQDQEDEICKIVRDIGCKMRDKIKKRIGISKQKKEEIKSRAETTEKGLNGMISSIKNILISSDFTSIMNYESNNEKFKDVVKDINFPCPFFLPRPIKQKQVISMFGEIHLLKKILETPVVLNTIQSPYGNDQVSQLWHVLCKGKEKLWTCGDNVIISEINRSGLISKTFKSPANVRA